MWGTRCHNAFGAVTILFSFALAIQAATNGLDETAARLLSAEERFNALKQGTVAEPVSGIVTHTPGRRLQERRIERSTKLDYDDRLATAPSSQALILTPQQAAALGPEGVIRIQRLTGPVAVAIRVEKGKLYFKSIGAPQPDGAIKLLLSSGDVTLAGTEFYVEADPNGATRVLMLDGSAQLAGQTNSSAHPVALNPGDQGEVAAEIAPQVQSLGSITKELFNQTVQWCLYYPAVLFLEDLSEQLRHDRAYQPSFGWYQTGAVQRAWETLPPEGEWNIEEKKLYAAALRLALGDVEGSQKLLALIEPQGAVSLPTSPQPSPHVGRAERQKRKAADEISPAGAGPVSLSGPARVQRLAGALRQLIAAVKFDQTFTPSQEPQLSTEWLARSYYLQSSVHDPRNIEAALAAARRALTVSSAAPHFAYAWAQVAALEFSRGQVQLAQAAVAQALRLAPSNAAPYALQGFLLAAQERRADALASLQQALELNTKLGDAWLGLGLMAFHHNDPQSGLERLQLAVVHEPQRSVLRSYLGKGYHEAATYTSHPLASLRQLFIPGDAHRAALLRRATNELHLARLLDPKDPTPDLYSALMKQQQNRINEAVRELERSQELNDHRRLYRSGLLLDQDQAVRSANLAAIYRDAGLADWSVREATRAVNRDYANYSAHLFLANSYDALRDPTRFNLRYETAWFNEQLLADLLAPVGAGTLSQSITQREYSRLFDANRTGLTSSTEYFSTGDWHQTASQFGSIGLTEWSLDLDFYSRAGTRPNNDLVRADWYTRIKQELPNRDSVFLWTKYQSYRSGDTRQLQDPAAFAPDFRLDNAQEPLLLAAYHREWQPGSHTILLAGRLENDSTSRDRQQRPPVITANPLGEPTRVARITFGDFSIENKFEIYLAEVNQIYQTERSQTVAGARFQLGEFDTQDRLDLLSNPANEAIFRPPVMARHTADFRRASAYAYHTVEPARGLFLTGGLTYDHLVYPANFRFSPITSGEDSRERFSPKFAITWAVHPKVAVRGLYSRALGGASFDESFRLEPAQLAGFTQGFRTLISESEVGSVSAPHFETSGIALDAALGTKTYLSGQLDVVRSDVRQDIGAFNYGGGSRAEPGRLAEELEYQERSFSVTWNQILSDTWTFGLAYRWTDAELKLSYPSLEITVPGFATLTARSGQAELHRAAGSLWFNHPRGWFAQAESNWYIQRNSGYAEPRPNDTVHQLNLLVGYRFPQRRAELALGVLNTLDQDYRLNPLTLYNELPRERTLYTRLRLRL
ncbi:MAG: hypothetical protein L0Z50_17360 [Verrucomicrobiales bacterium]|nr:hypothetical protein [Verrucomicrobiales bacterium]